MMRWTMMAAAGVVAVTAMAAGAGQVCVGEGESGKGVEVRVGDTIVVRLAGNPTTGYSWIANAVDGEAVRAVGPVAYAADARPGDRRLGVGGTFTATFEAVRGGQAKIGLEYKRPWEKNTPPARTFALTVKVAAAASKPAGAGQGAEPPADGQTIEFTGTLRTGIMAIGGETTGVVIAGAGRRYELNLGQKDPGRRALAESLNGKEAFVKGVLRVRAGVEIRARSIIDVSELRAAPSGGPATRAANTPAGAAAGLGEQLAASKAKWLKAREACRGNYEYDVRFQSWVGFGHTTTIIVRDNKVAGRRFEKFDRSRAEVVRVPAPGEAAPPVAPARPEGWTETAEQLGTHKDGAAPCRTMDELYAEAEGAFAEALRNGNRVHAGYLPDGLLKHFFWLDPRIADDAPRHGPAIEAIRLGMPPACGPVQEHPRQ